jgi:hypothetical protein
LGLVQVPSRNVKDAAGQTAIESSFSSFAGGHLSISAIRTEGHSRPLFSSVVESKALTATDPDREDIRAWDWTLRLDVPRMELLFYALTRDNDFAGALDKAVVRHKEYWTKTEERRRDPIGFLAIELVSLAVIARDRQIPISIDSEYLPPSLIA